MPSTGKVHRRTIFETVEGSIMGAKTLSRAFSLLAEVIREVHLLHVAGRVHDNISVENIIILNGHARLADVDYAKHDEDNHHDDTTFFVAAEVHHGHYILVRPWMDDPVVMPSEDVDPPGPYEFPDITELMEPGTNVTPTPRLQPEELVFRHNPLHDLESVLWVALFLLFRTDITPGRTSDMTAAQWAAYDRARDRLGERLFFDRARRIVLITGAQIMADRAEHHPRVAAVCKELDGILAALRRAYHAAEGYPRRLAFDDILSRQIALPSGRRLSLHQFFGFMFARLTKLLAGDRDIGFGAS